MLDLGSALPKMLTRFDYFLLLNVEVDAETPFGEGFFALNHKLASTEQASIMASAGMQEHKLHLGWPSKGPCSA